MCLLQVVSTVTLLLKSSVVVDDGHHMNVWMVESIWHLIKQLRSPNVHYEIIKNCFFFAFILLPLERIAIIYVNIDKASNAYCLATLINTRCYCNKQKIWLDYWSQLNENDKTCIFDRFFLNYKYLCVKTVANIIKTLGSDILIEN